MESFTENQPQLIQALIQQMKTTMFLMDAADVHEYCEALELAPGLVELESNYSAFLRTEDWHILKAAQRLARYWKFRKELFRDRWLLR